MKKRAFGLVLSTVTAISLLCAGAAAASARIVLFTAKTNEFATSPVPLYMPRSVQIPPMGTSFVRNVVWQGWNTSRAVGRGTNMTSYGRINVRLVASRPRKDWKLYRACYHEQRQPLLTYYSRLFITIAAPVPKGLKPGSLVGGNFAAKPQVQC
jgi:hypothetical protein